MSFILLHNKPISITTIFAADILSLKKAHALLAIMKRMQTVIKKQQIAAIIKTISSANTE
jgi:hypothetical protein